MNWLESLSRTYDNNASMIGKRDDDGTILLPISHTFQSVQIECRLDDKGMLYDAIVLEKENATTLMPCTIDSISRTSAPVAHPLFDKLFYMAKDYEEYRSEKTKKLSSYHLYHEEIKKWCDSSYAHPYVVTLMNYLDKGTLISDLEKKGCLYLDEDNKLIEKWNQDGDKPTLFKVLNGIQADAVLRFSVQDKQGIHNLWEDRDVQTSFINYYTETLKEVDFDYITGEYVPCTTKNPSKIRNSADMAKLISSNDSQGFTYRGKFAEPKQAASIGFLSSQKAHNALKWLIEKQGIQYAKGELTIITWGDEEHIPLNPLNRFLENTHGLGCDRVSSLTYESYANVISKAFAGYGKLEKINQNKYVHIMALDSATKGRLSIVCFQNLLESEYMEKLKKWYLTCSWNQLVIFDKVDNKNIPYHYAGTPSPMEIIKAIYGDHVKDGMIKQMVRKILACILEDEKISRDLIETLKHRLYNPLAMEKAEYNRIGNIGCAIIRKYLIDKNKEDYCMGLDTESNNRDYLFGRILAYIDNIENYAIYKSGDTSNSRVTNAMRYMNQYQKYPLKTLVFLVKRIEYYLKKLGPKGIALEEGLTALSARIKVFEGVAEPLKDEFILGFFAQSNEFINLKKKNKNTESEEK